MNHPTDGNVVKLVLVERAPWMRAGRVGLMVRLFAWLRGGRVVWLMDFQGQPYQSIAIHDPFGGMWCPVHWFWKVGGCRLMPDGSVHQRSESKYIEAWKFAE